MAEEKSGSVAPGQLSEEARNDLLEMCEEQFAQLKKLHNEIILCEADGCDTPQEQSVKRLMTTDAELKHWLTVKPRLLTTNSEVLLQAGKDEMLKLCCELEMVVSCFTAKRDKLKENKELEQKWLDEMRQMLTAANDRVQRLRADKETLSEQTVLQDTKVKIEKVKAYEEKLMECLGDVLEKHVPPPQHGATSKKKKGITAELHEGLISVNEILELLMNKALNSPHDPYVTMDDTFWPPYTEMLLRYGIAVRHQENNFKIRLETFC